jgi:hypothetical protein
MALPAGCAKRVRFRFVVIMSVENEHFKGERTAIAENMPCLPLVIRNRLLLPSSAHASGRVLRESLLADAGSPDGRLAVVRVRR